jgi:hypothetical protein
MNTVAVALERAVAGAKDISQLRAAFDREWQKAEFADNAECVVVGVPETRARLWWLGGLTDLDPISVCQPPQAVFWMGLPNHATYKAGWRTARALARSGAGICVFFTVNPVIIRHARRFGFRARQAAQGTFLLGEGEG